MKLSILVLLSVPLWGQPHVINNGGLKTGIYDFPSTGSACGPSASGYVRICGNGNQLMYSENGGAVTHIGSGSVTWPSAAGISVCTGTPCTAWGSSLGLATTVGSPGVDTSVPSEKAVRTAISGFGVVSGGGTGLSSLNPYAILAGGTTSTGIMQQVSGLGTSGYVLTSNGPAALPTWQASGATIFGGWIDICSLSGVDCTGATDSSAGLASFATPDAYTGKTVFVPANAHIRTDHQFLIKGQENLTITSLRGYALQNYLGQPEIFGCGTDTGSVVKISRSGLGKMEGIGIYPKGWSCPSGSLFTTGLELANSDSGGYNTTNWQFNDLWVAPEDYSGTVTNFIGVWINGTPNMEEMRFHGLQVSCNYSTNSYGFYQNDDNADSTKIDRSSTIGACKRGIFAAAGVIYLSDSNVGGNGGYSVFGSGGAAIYQTGGCVRQVQNTIFAEGTGQLLNNNGDTAGSRCDQIFVNNQISFGDIDPTVYPVNVVWGNIQFINNQVGSGGVTPHNNAIIGTDTNAGHAPLGTCYTYGNNWDNRAATYNVLSGHCQQGTWQLESYPMPSFVDQTILSQNIGGLTMNAAANPSMAAVNPTCTGTCATTYTYGVSCTMPDGSHTAMGSGTASTSLQAATLDGAHSNELTYNSSTGAKSCDFYRLVGGTTQGKILTQTFPAAAWPVDNGLVASGSAPTTNTTGRMNIVNPGGFTASFDASGITANRTLTLPDLGGTVAVYTSGTPVTASGTSCAITAIQNGIITGASCTP